jgi:hypothetical protein
VRGVPRTFWIVSTFALAVGVAVLVTLLAVRDDAPDRDLIVKRSFACGYRQTDLQCATGAADVVKSACATDESIRAVELLVRRSGGEDVMTLTCRG